jgi:ParB/RepB/Spo0J family partition protein
MTETPQADSAARPANKATRRQRVASRISEAVLGLPPVSGPPDGHPEHTDAAESAALAPDPRHLVDALPTAGTERLVELPLDRVVPNPDQPRKSFPRRQMDELLESIRTSGLVQPVVVRPRDDGTYQLVAGERRYRAYRELQATDPRFSKIPAVVKLVGDADLPVVSLIENIVREDLNPIERAEALGTLKEHLGLTWDGVAQRVGISVRAVHFLTGTLKLREEFREALAAREITEKHARALQRLQASPEAAFELFEYLRATGITGDEALAIAAVLRRYPRMTAEEAHRYLTDDKVREQLPTHRDPAPLPPHVQLDRGLKAFLRWRPSVDTGKLSARERRELLTRTLEPALEVLDALVAELRNLER